ncbi:MAG: hypothetical protein FWH19_05145 [Treponema sp.]|nr:hypothetical protein [Treponema sp.]
MVRGLTGISAAAYIHNMSQGGRVSLPVHPSSLLYSNFEYVSGVAAPEGSNGISITGLRLLDVLIGQLNQIKQNSNSQFNLNPFNGIDNLIESIENQIRQAKAASQAMPYIPSPSAESGLVLDLTV